MTGDGDIRPARPAEAAAIQALVARAYAMYLPRMDTQPGPVLDDYAARVAKAEAFVLCDAGKLVGALVLIDQPDHLLLDNVAVDPAQQGRGFGRRLVDFAEAEARRRGYAEIRLYTNEVMHENVGLYERLGYAVTGRGEQAGYQRVFMAKTISD